MTGLGWRWVALAHLAVRGIEVLGSEPPIALADLVVGKDPADVHR